MSILILFILIAVVATGVLLYLLLRKKAAPASTTTTTLMPSKPTTTTTTLQPCFDANNSDTYVTNESGGKTLRMRIKSKNKISVSQPYAVNVSSIRQDGGTITGNGTKDVTVERDVNGYVPMQWKLYATVQPTTYSACSPVVFSIEHYL
jgi:hypothetical protein